MNQNYTKSGTFSVLSLKTVVCIWGCLLPCISALNPPEIRPGQPESYRRLALISFLCQGLIQLPLLNQQRNPFPLDNSLGDNNFL